MNRVCAFFAVCLACTGANAAPVGYFDLELGVMLETGDSWVADRQHYRLFGAQSCLRGTGFTDHAGNKKDCGAASMAVFAAYIKDTKPICAPVAKTSDIAYVVCYATVGGKRLDLATILISSGYAFAALKQDGLPYYPAYAVAEQGARDKHAGLWQFTDVQHPAILLSKEANKNARLVNQ